MNRSSIVLFNHLPQYCLPDIRLTEGYTRSNLVSLRSQTGQKTQRDSTGRTILDSSPVVVS